jgi:hypothetical protein
LHEYLYPLAEDNEGALAAMTDGYEAGQLDLTAQMQASQDYDFSEEHEFEMTDEANIHFQTSEQIARMARERSVEADLLHQLEMMHIAASDTANRPPSPEQRTSTEGKTKDDGRKAVEEIKASPAYSHANINQQVATIVPVSGDPFEITLSHSACVTDAKEAIGSHNGYATAAIKLFSSFQGVPKSALATSGALRDDALISTIIALGEGSRELFMVVGTRGDWLVLIDEAQKGRQKDGRPEQDAQQPPASSVLVNPVSGETRKLPNSPHAIAGAKSNGNGVYAMLNGKLIFVAGCTFHWNGLIDEQTMQEDIDICMKALFGHQPWTFECDLTSNTWKMLANNTTPTLGQHECTFTPKSVTSHNATLIIHAEFGIQDNTYACILEHNPGSRLWEYLSCIQEDCGACVTLCFFHIWQGFLVVTSLYYVEQRLSMWKT